jgi:hypothetical protein
MTRWTSTLALSLLCCLTFTGPVSATPIVWTFSGLATGALLTQPARPQDAQLLPFVNEPLVLVATLDTEAPNQCGAGSRSGIYRATNVSATFMGYTYPGGAVFEHDAPLGSCVPWVNEALFRFFISGNGAVQKEPDGTRVLFYPDSSGAGTFRIFMPARIREAAPSFRRCPISPSTPGAPSIRTVHMATASRGTPR